MWKGAIQFGLVTIPVKLYLATDSKGISFNMLHATDLSRIQMKTYCPVDDEVISRGDTVRGFEYAPGEYVVVTDEDLERVPLKTVRSIEIELFTRASRDQGTIRFVKNAYYLEPDKIGQKAFELLRSVLEDKGLTAICKVVIKDREALAALDPFGGTMLLSTLHWPDEIRSTTELDLPSPEQEFKPAELAMAEQLVAAMTGEFRADDYRDEYREALMAVIEEKVAGREVSAPAAPAATGTLVDLMAALEASVNAAKVARAAEAPVSVTEAKSAKAARVAKAEKAAEAAGAARAFVSEEPVRAVKAAPSGASAAEPDVVSSPGSAADENIIEARPSRRRKSA
jgi:DNA end-binding protein Ku